MGFAIVLKPTALKYVLKSLAFIGNTWKIYLDLGVAIEVCLKIVHP